MTISAAQQTALERPRPVVVYFVEFEFQSGTTRLCSALLSMTWGGYEWGGVGAIASISAVEETGGLAPRGLKFEIKRAQPAWMALALGSEYEYRGRAAKLYMCPLDEQYRLIGMPERCWTGRMQAIEMSEDGGEGSIVLNCETSAFDLRRASGLRRNNAQHQKKYPGERGLEYQEDLNARQYTWMSKRFQER